MANRTSISGNAVVNSAALQALLLASLANNSKYTVKDRNLDYIFDTDAVFGDIQPTDRKIGVNWVPTFATSLLTLAAHGFVNGDKVFVTSSLAIATGLIANSLYFVVGATANTIQLSLTSGGAAVSFTTNGQTITLTPDFTTDVFTAAAHGLINGTEVLIDAATTMPVGLLANQIYFVVNATANTFKVSLTAGGAAVDYTTNGVGAVTARGVIRVTQAGFWSAIGDESVVAINGTTVITRLDNLNLRVNPNLTANVTITLPVTNPEQQVNMSNPSAFSVTFVASDASTILDLTGGTSPGVFPAGSSGALFRDGSSWVVS